MRAFAELALEKGVRRQVLPSGRGEEEAQRSEEAVQEMDADLTIVRCAWFMQNFSEHFMLEGVLDGELVLPAGDQPEPFVDADDIADVAVAALTDDRHIGELYELTSPRVMTFPDAVAEIAGPPAGTSATCRLRSRSGRRGGRVGRASRVRRVPDLPVPATSSATTHI